MAETRTGIEGNTGLLGLVGDFFRSERRFILLDEIGLTRVRRSLLLKGAIVDRWFLRKVFIYILVYFGERRSLHGLFCFVLCLSQFLISNQISVRTLYGPVRERVSGPSLVRDIGIKIDKCMSNKVRLGRR